MSNPKITKYTDEKVKSFKSDARRCAYDWEQNKNIMNEGWSTIDDDVLAELKAKAQKWDSLKEKIEPIPTWGNPRSWMLNKLIEAGHKPIGITTMCCEEVFIFEKRDEIEPARAMYGNEGYWYSREDFIVIRERYVKDYLDNDMGTAPLVHWL